MDWGRFLLDAQTWLHRESEKPDARRSQAPDPSSLDEGAAWVGAVPKVSIVARDWGNALRIRGKLALTDEIRLTRSNRMVLSRVRLGDGRFIPFGQLGIGEWRIDTTMMPLTPATQEVAGQVGAGFELRLSPSWQLAFESNMTALYREAKDPASLPVTRMFGTMLASRLEF